MKKHYKVKEVNKTELKSYLTNANTKNSTGHTRSSSRNGTVLSVTTFSNIELALKIVLLVLSIAYTIDKWYSQKKKSNEKKKVE